MCASSATRNVNRSSPGTQSPTKSATPAPLGSLDSTVIRKLIKKNGDLRAALNRIDRKAQSQQTQIENQQRESKGHKEEIRDLYAYI